MQVPYSGSVLQGPFIRVTRIYERTANLSVRRPGVPPHIREVPFFGHCGEHYAHSGCRAPFLFPQPLVYSRLEVSHSLISFTRIR
jgi:hypothetical protein